MKDFLVMSINLPINNLEHSQEIITDIKFAPYMTHMGGRVPFCQVIFTVK